MKHDWGEEGEVLLDMVIQLWITVRGHSSCCGNAGDTQNSEQAVAAEN